MSRCSGEQLVVPGETCYRYLTRSVPIVLDHDPTLEIGHHEETLRRKLVRALASIDRCHVLHRRDTVLEEDPHTPRPLETGRSRDAKRYSAWCVHTRREASRL